jgi:hypothetical protein
MASFSRICNALRQCRRKKARPESSSPSRVFSGKNMWEESQVIDGQCLVKPGEWRSQAPKPRLCLHDSRMIWYGKSRAKSGFSWFFLGVLEGIQAFDYFVKVLC